MSARRVPTVALSNGVLMPAIGLGTYQNAGAKCQEAVRNALNAGYRHIDTATVYRNEEDIGLVLREYIGKPLQGNVLQRSDLFITSKLAPNDHGYDETRAAIRASLSRLGLDYLDLYLVHWPGKTKLKPSDPMNQQWRRESWRAMEEAYKERIVHAIGVSNYTEAHLQQLLDDCTVRPMVNQVEFHPMLDAGRVLALLDFHRAQGVVLEAYSSFAEGLLLGPGHRSAAAALRVLSEFIERKWSQAGRQPTLAQFLLAWAWCMRVPVIPKTIRLERVRENMEMLDYVKAAGEGGNAGSVMFEEAEARKLFKDVFEAQGRREVKVCWDPEKVN